MATQHSRVQRLILAYRTRGSRYVLAKILAKIYKKLIGEPPPIPNLPEMPQSEDPIYQKWLNKTYPRQADLQKLAETMELFHYQPKISVIVPVFNTSERFLREAVNSVLDQIYPEWELCLVDDASTEPHVKDVLKDYVEQDARIKAIFRSENGHISAASNTAIAAATGEFIALLDHDDRLTPDALYEVAFMLNRFPQGDMVYSDEDKVQDDGQLRDPFFKPDWCPDSFLSRMYTAHLGVYRRTLVEEIGGFREGYEGSQDYDLVLRLSEKTDRIYHIPKILYHWRIHEGSTAASLSNKNYAHSAAYRALADALKRRDESARVLPTLGGYHIVRYDIQETKPISIIIPTRDLAEVLGTCLQSIFTKSTYPDYEVIVIDNGSCQPKTFQLFEQWQQKEPERFRVEKFDIPFNYSKLNNYGASQAKGDYLLFLNNDTEVVSADWLEAMVEQAQRPSIGAVGVKLLYSDDTIQHAGVLAGIGDVAGHSHKYYPANDHGYFGQLETINNYSAVTAACLMCRKDLFEAVDGFEEALTVAFNDVDFCLKIVEQGYRNIYLPHVVLYHYESKSRGYEDTPEKLARSWEEIAYMQQKWPHRIARDPCYNPNLTGNTEDYSLRL